MKTAREVVDHMLRDGDGDSVSWARELDPALAQEALAHAAEVQTLRYEIERLQARNDQLEDLFVHSSKLMGKQDAKIERLRKALRRIANMAIPIQREEHRIARVAYHEHEGDEA